MERPEPMDVAQWAETLEPTVQLMQPVLVLPELPGARVEPRALRASQQGAQVARQQRRAQLEQA